MRAVTTAMRAAARLDSTQGELISCYDAVIVIVALAALATPGYRAEWINLVLGGWLFISPWVLRYTGIKDGSWSAWIFGVVTVLLALWALPTHGEVGQTVRPSNRLDLR